MMDIGDMFELHDLQWRQAELPDSAEWQWIELQNRIERVMDRADEPWWSPWREL